MRRLDRPPPAWRPSGPALPGGRTPRASNSWAMAANVVLPVRRISAITVRVVALALAPCPDLAARALPSWRCWPCRASCGPRLADALPRPLCRYARIILRTLRCTHRSLLVVDRTEQCCGVCLPSFTTRGSASCSLAPMICQQCQHPTANIEGKNCRRFRAPVRYERIPGRLSRRARNSVSYAKRGAPSGN